MKMADYIEFNLDGEHNRLVTDWAHVGARREIIPAGVSAGYHTSKGRWIPPRRHDAITVVYTVPWRKAARKWAREHGAAGAWHCDDSLTLFYRDGDKVRQKTFRHARPVKQASRPNGAAGQAA